MQHGLPARNYYYSTYSGILSVFKNLVIILNVRNVKNVKFIANGDKN